MYYLTSFALKHQRVAAWAAPPDCKTKAMGHPPRRRSALGLARVNAHAYDDEDPINRRLRAVSTRYAMQVGVFCRPRHGAGQYVRVEHVHIHDGGQAVIGEARAADGVAFSCALTRLGRQWTDKGELAANALRRQAPVSAIASFFAASHLRP